MAANKIKIAARGLTVLFGVFIFGVAIHAQVVTPPPGGGSGGTTGPTGSTGPAGSLGPLVQKTTAYSITCADFAAYSQFYSGASSVAFTLSVTGCTGGLINVFPDTGDAASFTLTGTTANGQSTLTTLPAGTGTAGYSGYRIEVDPNSSTNYKVWTIQGAAGATGATGSNGSAGATGATGPTGATGATGSVGVSSAAGNTTPVTVSANTTADQALMEVPLSAGILNQLSLPYYVDGSGLMTIGAAQTPTLTFKAKLCTVSGCGSGTVITLASLTTAATIAATNNPWNLHLIVQPTAVGASGTVLTHGFIAIDIGAVATLAETVYNDSNTAASSAINLTGLLYVDFTVSTSAGSATNSVVQQLGDVTPGGTTGASGSTGPTGATGATGSATFATPGTSHTFSGTADIFVCTSTCSMTTPVPVAGVQYCAMNDDNISTVITFLGIGSSARYENTARTAYGTAGTGTLVSGGAAADTICIVGRDSTHYLTVSFNGTWTAN